MRLRLLGTGSADGWPNPWCGCASCEWAREHQVRTQTAVLVDDRLLIDCGPDVPRAATRFGVRLADVRHLLFSHAHGDHTGPAALLWRTWSTVATRPLDVVGPPASLDACRPFVAPPDGDTGALRFRLAHAGDVLSLDGFEIRALAANHGAAFVGPALLYDITAPDGGRLLYACDTAAPLPPATLDALTGRAFDVVLMEENNGDRPGFGDHLDLATFADVLARLRRREAVVETTRVVAVHLSHRNPPGDELARRLALMGAHLYPDGTVIATGTGTGGVRGTTAPGNVLDAAGGDVLGTVVASGAPGSTTSNGVLGPAGTGAGGTGTAGTDGGGRPERTVFRGTRPPVGPPRPYRVLITGGARSGKSAEAERRLTAWPEVVYVATAGPVPPGDSDWAARVAAHRTRRPSHWTTLETTDLPPLLRADGPPLLIDCLTLWLTAHLSEEHPDDGHRAGNSPSDDGATGETATGETSAGEWPTRLRELLAAWRDTRRHVIAVTNEVGSGVVPATAVGRRFRDALGRLNAAVAAESDEVWHVVAGIPTRLR
ncbi:MULTISPECIES: bifunctional adenosylcobinamide kinase/adenosylcobinamide-phosphate guanylyltransferase [Protofrankia]|uniref:Adenosylcobinamide kinase n=1 Tax=Candidatus Protofrankia datiscae TaxID=2716812 RepID=F8AZ43_9ACTN|nr:MULTISPECIES: bifunctional adenosylcobinamide kinase/adenosylcobinamide-phosphate guanylyltransferase [Protofrankia]AEH10510.1 Adenosylcobinamide-phosphate guanylyltransferase [Candidatus Protofrankia datiscae]